MIPHNVGQQDYQTLYHLTRLVSTMNALDQSEHECHLLDATNETVLNPSVPTNMNLTLIFIVNVSNTLTNARCLHRSQD